MLNANHTTLWAQPTSRRSIRLAVARPSQPATASFNLPRRSARKMTAAAEVLARNQELLTAIAAGNYEKYATMCDPSMTCFEPEAVGHLVEGLDFHKYYFTMPSSAPPAPDAPKPHVLNTMASPHVRVVGDSCAIVSYIRLTQKMVNGAPVTVQAEETRVWEKKNGSWIHVHMHRSLVK
ncbi:hypothetical protein HYH02_009862 [Chlamydomonas schloesseri]|uniref:Calcium/calmodulin-dependent protein kinase II association-domain domain-containing protein n=1 Tax=Chlamydomonas schloesseri TaxID=2026947 RepID=A0A835TNC3_9CHLO|nr:hypothetical protein HYH02_009862 [Chlamydomonas schloesseri]|eukprot:KAG2442071.1 hypothetical protein HYH02_009862 [Chlamydomonas schloesseri]